MNDDVDSANNPNYIVSKRNHMSKSMSKLTAKQLRTKASELHINTSGSKKALIDRILDKVLA